MDILITGGLGFIGSNIISILDGFKTIIIIDDLSNSKHETYNILTHLRPKESIKLYTRSLHNESIDDIFETHNICVIVHCAGVKSVKESISNPLKYYEINVSGTINLLKCCDKYKVQYFIFSSSATVYGDSPSPLTESSLTGTGISNAYGRSKYMIEQILKDYFNTGRMSIIILRYFNPVGAHPSGLLGDDPNGTPNNLMPYITKVATGVYDKVYIYGNDYDTIDGTPVRDYIHVMDLAQAHIKSITYISSNSKPIFEVFNIGTGTGVSVKHLIETFSRVNNVNIPYCYINRREGDAAITYANVDKTKDILHFEANKTLQDMVRDSYNYAINKSST